MSCVTSLAKIWCWKRRVSCSSSRIRNVFLGGLILGTFSFLTAKQTRFKEALSITAILANRERLWACACGSGRMVLSSQRVTSHCSLTSEKRWSAGLGENMRYPSLSLMCIGKSPADGWEIAMTKLWRKSKRKKKKRPVIKPEQSSALTWCKPFTTQHSNKCTFPPYRMRKYRNAVLYCLS